MAKKVDIAIRLKRFFTEGGPAECWEWQGYISPDGYARVNMGNGKLKLAHRLVYEIMVGPIPEGMFICHHCDNPKCMNYRSHLFIGTNGDNMRDASQKGRVRNGGLRGSRLSQSKLNEQIVSEILKSSESHISLGRKFGVDISTIWKVRNRRTWNHVKVEEEGYPNR